MYKLHVVYLLSSRTKIIDSLKQQEKGQQKDTTGLTIVGCDGMDVYKCTGEQISWQIFIFSNWSTYFNEHKIQSA